MPNKFIISEIKVGKFKGQFRFTLLANNKKKIDPRQPYNSKQSVRKVLALLNSDKKWLLVDETVVKKKKEVAFQDGVVKVASKRAADFLSNHPYCKK